MKTVIKLIGILAITFIFLCNCIFAQNNYPRLTICKDGIFIECGNEIPRNFSYKIQKTFAGKEEWEDLVILHFSGDKQVFFNDLYNLQETIDFNFLFNQSFDDQLWDFIGKTAISDSVPFAGVVPIYLAALKTAYFDSDVKLGSEYKYKVTRIDKNANSSGENVSKPIKFNEKKNDIKLSNSKALPGDENVILEYKVGYNDGSFYRAKIFKSVYLQTDFEDAGLSAGISSREGNLIISCTDTNVREGGIYLYFVVPYDKFGNAGAPSDTVRVNNTSSNSKSIAAELRAISDTANKAIILKWKYMQHKDLVGINIYKSTNYDKDYELIANLSKEDSVYIDGNVNPIQTYFYYIETQTVFGRSVPSTRVIGMLEAAYKAIAPHTIDAINTADNIVKITWSKPSVDTRAYYVFRSVNMEDSNFVQVSCQILDDTSNVITYYDTVNIQNLYSYYYAIKSENTSYDISPFSEKVSVSIQKPKMDLPVPMNLNARSAGDGSVLLVWDNMEEIDYAYSIASYKVYRKILKSSGEDSTDFVELNNSQEEFPEINNYFEDKDIKPGITYLYAVKTIGKNGEESALSAPTQAYIPIFRPLSIQNISAVKVDGSEGITLSWNKTSQTKVVKYKIYRKKIGSPQELISELEPETEQYIDKTNLNPSDIFYAITCVDIDGIESSIEEWSGIEY